MLSTIKGTSAKLSVKLKNRKLVNTYFICKFICEIIMCFFLT